MNKISKVSVLGFKEWACGKTMLGGFICGEPYGRYKFAICDRCLCKMVRRKDTIEAFKKNKLLDIEERHKMIKHIELGITKV